MLARLAVLALIAGFLAPASDVLAAIPHQPTPGQGSIGIRLIALPGGSGANPLARLYVLDRLAPGTTIRRRVEIINTTRAMADVTIYPAAAMIVRGAFEFAAAVDGQDELSSWTSVTSHAMRLAPDTDAVDTLTIKVPREASPGQRYAVLWAQVATPSATDGVLLVNRVGVRMYVSIGPGGALPPDFEISSPTARRSAAGQPVVTAEIYNSGGGPLEISGHLILSDGPGGLGAGPFPAQAGTVLEPGSSEPVTVSLEKGLPVGPWRADLWLTSGLLQKSAEATITFPGQAGARLKSHWPALAIILPLVLLALLVLLVLVISRRRRSGRRRRPGVNA